MIMIFRNLDQQLFNKANEIQEEISKKRYFYPFMGKNLEWIDLILFRYDLRCYQIKLSGIRAQVSWMKKEIKDIYAENLVFFPEMS